MTQIQQNNTTSFLVQWLEKPYTLHKSITYKVLMSIVMGIISFAYLWFFKPQYMLSITNNPWHHSVSVGVTVTLVLFFYYFIIQRIFPTYFDAETWNIGSHIGAIVCLLIFGSTVFWLYQNYAPTSDLVRDKDLNQVILYIFSVGIIPITIFFFIDERYSTYQQKKLALSSDISVENEYQHDKIIEEIIENKEVKIYSYNEKDDITFDVNELVYITSESNYASFYVIEKDDLKELILRKPLAKIEQDLSKFDEIVRFHKSYLINTKYVRNYRGNARGYFLSIDYVDKELPVSRKFTREELEDLI